MAAWNSYKHKSLDLQKSQIRLFRLSSKHNGDLEGEIRTHDFEDGPSYRAVSYMWGPPSPTREITIEGRSFTIRDNLWQFLNSAHNLDDAWLWIDQICIDQETVKERNHQVSLMSTIYARADEVLIWLGSEADGSSEGIAAINSGYTAVAQHGQQVQALFERPYWNRLWIIQEVLLSQKAVVMCGDQVFDLGQLARMYIRSTGNPSVDETGYPVLISYWILAIMRYVFSSEKFEKQCLSSILNSFAMSECEDARDKVFGLLSLVQSSAAIAVDYSKTATEVFFDTIHQIVNNENDRKFDDHVGVALILRDSMDLRIENSFIKSYINQERTNPGKSRGNENTKSLLLAIQRGDIRTTRVLLGADSECVNGKDSDGRTLLMRATMQRDKNTVEKLLDMCNPDVEAQDMDGMTPLLRAIALEDLAIVDALLTVGNANTEAKDTTGSTCLMLAISKGHEALVKLLLHNGKPNLEARDRAGRTPLMHAIIRGKESIVKLLLCVGKTTTDPKGNDAHVLDHARFPLDMNLVNTIVEWGLEYEDTPMHLAAASGNSNLVAMLLAEESIKPDEKDSFRRTPLMIAVRSKCTSVVEMLLARDNIKADQTDSQGWSPLMMAAEDGCTRVVGLLLAKENIRADEKNNSGWSPLMIAAREGHTRIVEMLLAREDVKVDEKDYNGLTPLMEAAREGYTSIVRMLLARENIRTDEKDYKGATPLMDATLGLHKDVVDLLLRTGKVDTNVTDWAKRTPLFFAVTHEWKSTVKALLAFENTKIDVQDVFGTTPLMVAARSGQKEIAELLLNTGKAGAEAKDLDGKTAQNIADEAGHKELVQLLRANNGLS